MLSLISIGFLVLGEALIATGLVKSYFKHVGFVGKLFVVTMAMMGFLAGAALAPVVEM